MNTTAPVRPRVSTVKVSVEKIYSDPPTYGTTILMTTPPPHIIDQNNFDNYPKLRFADGTIFSTVGLKREFFDPPTNKVTYFKEILFEYRPDITVEVDELKNGEWSNASFEWELIPSK